VIWVSPGAAVAGPSLTLPFRVAPPVALHWACRLPTAPRKTAIFDRFFPVSSGTGDHPAADSPPATAAAAR